MRGKIVVNIAETPANNIVMSAQIFLGYSSCHVNKIPIICKIALLLTRILGLS